jgi:hypothetical protein
MEGRSDGFTAAEDRYAGYTVYDRPTRRSARWTTCSSTRTIRPNTLG